MVVISITKWTHRVPEMSIFGQKGVFKDGAFLLELYMLRKIQFDIQKAKKLSFKNHKLEF